MISRRGMIQGMAIGMAGGLTLLGGGLAQASDVAKDPEYARLRAEADTAMQRLVSSQPDSAQVIEAAKGLLIFPSIVKGGLLIGAAGGQGVFRSGGEVQGYYLSTAVSYGLQAGVTTFGYIMAFMDQASIDYLNSSSGWEVGVGPVVTVADEGFARKMTTTTLQEGVVVFFIDQKGFFAGAGLEGTKITKL